LIPVTKVKVGFNPVGTKSSQHVSIVGYKLKLLYRNVSRGIYCHSGVAGIMQCQLVHNFLLQWTFKNVYSFVQ